MTLEPKNTRAERRFDLPSTLYFGVFMIVLARFLQIHGTLGFTFPVPWPDEASFLWQALAFRDTGSLYAPELYPFREVFWMPPGYMVFSGLVFKLTSFSLSWARWLSALYLSGAMAWLGLMLRGSAGRYGHLALIALFSSSPIVTLSGNTARMEPLVCLIVVGGFCVLLAGRQVAGLALLLLGPLVHPNAAFALIAGVGYALAVVFTGSRKTDLKNWEIALLVLALMSWGAYIAHVIQHGSDFLSDMQRQLVWKRAELRMNGGVLVRLKQPAVLVTSALLVLAWVGVLGFARQLLAIAVLASALLVQVMLTAGWMYELYVAFLYLLVLILLNEVASVLILGNAPENAGRPRLARTYSVRWLRFAAVFAASGLLAAGMFLALTRDSFAKRSVETATVGRASRWPSYFVNTDRATLTEVLTELGASSKLHRVQFLPDADSLLFHDLRSPKLRFVQATYYDATADVYVFHDSVWVPRLVKDLSVLRLVFHQHISAPIDSWQVLLSRDQTERWLIYRREPF